MAFENDSTKLPFNDETANAGNRGRRNGKGVKKIPQRGVGIEKLEKMRVAESLKSFHFPQQQQQQQVIFNNNNNNNMNNVVGSGFSGSFVGNKSGVGVGASSSSSSSNGYGWFGRNNNSSKELSSIPNLNHHHHHHQSLLKNSSNGFASFVGNNKSGFTSSSSSFSNGYGWFVKNPFENSSIPNLNHHQSLDLCLKKTRLNEENIMMRGASYAKREMPLEIWNPHHGFLGFMPQPNSSVSAYYPTQNHDECVEVVAVHRKGNSSFGSGRIFMEYDFFPEKDGKSTSTTTTIAKDFFPTATSGEASSSITAASYGDASMAYDSLDLSLRL